MKHKKLVIRAIKVYLKRIAFDANLYERGLCDTPHARNCAKDRKKLMEVIAELQG